jgi:glycosyltransferase involved in cell wall biosynthesis
MTGLPVKGCLVGDGPQRAEYQALATELSLQDHVTWTGVVANPEDYLQAFDIACLFSDREGMPNALLEAMSVGKPIVASAVGATPELLDGGSAGILVDPVNQADIDRNVIRLANNPGLRAALGQSAKARANQMYSLENCMRELNEHYHSTLSL